MERTVPVGLLEGCHELATEERAQDLDRQEVVVAAGHPACAIGGQPAAGDHAVQVGVEEQVLAPGVKHAGDAGLRAEELGVARDGGERPGGRPEEDVEDGLLVAQSQGVEIVGDCEDDVEIGHR